MLQLTVHKRVCVIAGVLGLLQAIKYHWPPGLAEMKLAEPRLLLNQILFY
jgi:hypothetical protein